MYNEAYLDGIAQSWHAAHKHTRQLDGHSKKVRSRPAASVSWEVSACRCCVHRMQCQVHSVAWNCTGKRIASGSVDQTARIWTMAEGRHVKDIELRGHQDSVDQLRWDPGNADILSKHTSAVQMRFFWRVGALTWLAWLGTASGDKTVRIWDARSGKNIETIKTTGENINICWSPDSKLIAVGNKARPHRRSLVWLSCPLVVGGGHARIARTRTCCRCTCVCVHACGVLLPRPQGRA